MIHPRSIAYAVFVGAAILGAAYIAFLAADAETRRPTAPPHQNSPAETAAGIAARQAELTRLRQLGR